MNRRHRRILRAIFAEPTSGTVRWDDIQAILLAVGCRIVEGSGSRVRFVHGDSVETFHRPHPSKEAKRYQVRAARDFIRRLGIVPEQP